MRVLITGASGFAGTWLCRQCAEAGDEVVALSRRGLVPDGCGQGVAVDMRDSETVREAVRAAAPELVYHLASLTSVGRSWESPAQTLVDNDAINVGMLEALRHVAGGAPVVWVSSCEVYGNPDVLPATEALAPRPANPYAVSKVSGEMLAELYADAYGLEIVRARPFSHSGPGQLPIFLLSSLASQAAEGRAAGVSKLEIVTGNPETRRDFTDVRDVVRAYRLLAQALVSGKPGAAGGVFNVSTGRSVSAGDQVALLTELLAPIEVEHTVDPARVRASEVMDLRGDPARLRALTGWEPKIPLRQTMADTIDWWAREQARSAA
ncbi:MAG TPA: GDP-mannose 4,6-dehydratase [Solirubrobacteraceae bacterium]|jgi:GDP-4-dehydro-6-deoxy-D-mannose reductase|nr:GDP-mannose 4,6-dehydratase [Solirubrobacteraceae bacterium]